MSDSRKPRTKPPGRKYIVRKPGPDSFVGMGMTNAKFVRRWKLLLLITGTNDRSFFEKYAVRQKFRTRVVCDGLFPYYRDVDEMCQALGITREIYCGPESILIQHLQRRRAWELNIDTSTWRSSGGACVTPSVETKPREEG